MHWEKELDIRAPIAQAERCLDLWLAEENKRLPRKDRARTAALMARYFQHEDDVTDQLMLSFLRHYSGRMQLDMEDPTSVRLEIKAALDKSIDKSSTKTAVAAGILAACFMACLFLFGAWELMHKRITRTEEAALKELVHSIALLEKDVTRAAIWLDVKELLQARSYQDITWWQYRRASSLLQERLDTLVEKRLALAPRAGM